jgi:serine/threonine protein kinase
MLPETISLADRQRRLEEIVFSYEKALDAGQPLDRQQLLNLHAELADELKSYFADLDRLQQSAAFPDAVRDAVVVESLEYEVIEEIDRGGMGVVLRSRDRDLGRDLAIKVMRSEHKDNPVLVHRFIKEAEICGRLQHPGIVPVHKKGRLSDGRPYFTMKLVEGETLASLLKRRQVTKELPHFLAAFDQVCQAMAYAHSRQVIHRDLKPANIMVGIHGDVQVMDWGLAKDLGEDGTKQHSADQPREDDQSVIAADAAGTVDKLSRAGDIIGTPAYMAPEQAQGRVNELDTRCDVFSLGAILCEMLTGKPPYIGQDVLAKAQTAHLADALVSLDTCGADKRLIYLAMHCLSSNPNHRPQNAGQVARRLREYLAFLEGSPQMAKEAEEKCRAAQEEVRCATAKVAETEHRLKVAYNWLKGAAAALFIAVIGWTGSVQKTSVESRSNSAPPLKVTANEREPLPAPSPPDNSWTEDEDRRDKETLFQKVVPPTLSTPSHPDRFAWHSAPREEYAGFNSAPWPWRGYIDPLHQYQASRPDFLGTTTPGFFTDPFSGWPEIHSNYGFAGPIGAMEYRPPTITPDINILQRATLRSESLRSVEPLLKANVLSPGSLKTSSFTPRLELKATPRIQPRATVPVRPRLPIRFVP